MAGLFSLDLDRVGAADAATFRIDAGTRRTTDWRDGCLLMHVESLRTCALNAVGARVWSLLESGCSLGEIVDALQTEYEATAPLIRRGVRAFLDDLLAKGFIVRAGADPSAPTIRLHG